MLMLQQRMKCGCHRKSMTFQREKLNKTNHYSLCTLTLSRMVSDQTSIFASYFWICHDIYDHDIYDTCAPSDYLTDIWTRCQQKISEIVPNLPPLPLWALYKLWAMHAQCSWEWPYSKDGKLSKIAFRDHRITAVDMRSRNAILPEIIRGTSSTVVFSWRESRTGERSN